MILFIINIVMAAILYGIGLLLNERNASSYLSSYNTMSPKEKEDFNIKGYLRFFRHFHFFLGGSLAVFSVLLFIISNEDALGYLLVFYPLIAYIYFIYETKKYYPDKERKGLNIALWVLIIAIIFSATLLYYGNKSNEFIIHEHQIEITGIYGEEIDFKEIKQLSLCDNFPKLSMKTNGFAMNNTKKGYFKTKDGEKVKLILNSLELPCLFIELNSGEKIYYSETTEINQKLFEEYSIKTSHQSSNNN